MHGGVVVAAAGCGGLAMHALNGYWGLMIAKKLAGLLRGTSTRGTARPVLCHIQMSNPIPSPSPSHLSEARPLSNCPHTARRFQPLSHWPESVWWQTLSSFAGTDGVGRGEAEGHYAATDVKKAT